MGIRVRLTLIFTALLAIVIAAAGLVLFVSLRTQLRSTIDQGLLSRAEVIRSAERLPERASLIEADESFAQIIDAYGNVVASSTGLSEKPLLELEALEDVSRPRFHDSEIRIGNETTPARLLAVEISGGRVLIVGSSVEDQREAVAILSGLLFVGGPTLVGLAGLIVWWMTGAALRPVDRLREEADALSISDVGRPLSLPDTNDEIGRLGKSLNGFLERLAQALRRERRFVDDASHELRTPVATLKGELELALSRSTTPEEMRAAVERAMADADDLALLTEDLLVLARADRGRLPIRREEVDLRELVEQVTSGFTHRAQSRGISINLDVNGSHLVDPLRVRQVLNNLLDNALRHCPQDGVVSVKSIHEDAGLILEVEDTGPGFPGEVLSSPFEPFARSIQERARDGGAGLGLTIVKAIVEAHGGTVELSNRGGRGARIVLRFPNSSQI